MTISAENIESNHRFLLRCGFFSVEYSDENKIVKTEHEENKHNKNTKQVNKYETRKMNKDCKYTKKKIKVHKIIKGLDIIGKIIMIGSALSGLLPSLRRFVLREIIT